MQKALSNHYIDQFKLVSLVHESYQTTVYEATSTMTGKVAIKVFQSNDKSYFQNQSTVLSQLKIGIFPKVITIRKSTYIHKGKQKYPCSIIVMEFIQGGNLYQAIKQYGRFSKIVAKTFFKQLVDTIDHLHYRGIAHRDIKLSNIMLTQNFELKLIDFEFAVKVDPINRAQNLTEVIGTRQYMAPQIYQQRYNGVKVDIFACGVVLFFMVAGCLPFQTSQSQDIIYDLIRYENWKDFWYAHSQKQPLGLFTHNFKHLFERLVCLDSNKRLTAKQILKHPWIKDQQIDKSRSQIHSWFAQKQKQQKENNQENKIKNCKSLNCLKGIAS